MLRLLLSRSAAITASVVAVSGALFLAPSSVSAHNSLVSSDPADGSALEVAPTQVTWLFDKPVPLETLTVTLIDATGIRTELVGSVHGPTGENVVVTPLPVLLPGPVSVRWRLVGPDGHPVTGRVDITVSQPAVATSQLEAAPTTSVAQVSPNVPSVPGAPTGDSADVTDRSYSMGPVVRWAVRYVSYAAIMAIVGILLTSATVWPGAGDHPLLRRIVSGSLFATVALGFIQLLVLASDVSGRAPWSSFGSIATATTTDAGMALSLRIALALSMWVVLFAADIAHRDVYWTAVAIPGLGLLGTWAFAGHSASMRWPVVGVIVDVVHHAAAGLWIGGLAIVGRIVLAASKPAPVEMTVRRFSSVAAVCVGVLVATGAIQALRLVGSPLALLEATHGRLLVAKLAILGVMLAMANTNRRRLARGLSSSSEIERDIGALRRAVLGEFVTGVAIVGLTAAMVVSPPSAKDASAPSHRATPVYYVL